MNSDLLVLTVAATLITSGAAVAVVTVVIAAHALVESLRDRGRREAPARHVRRRPRHRS